MNPYVAFSLPQSNPQTHFLQSDLEAQPLSSTTANPSSYLHTGRGGAGNFVQPSQLTSQGLTQDAPPIKNIIVGAAKPTYRGGRGGAGNYVDTVEEERLRKEDEERARRENEEAVVRDVERGLARPERAYGVGGGSWEMGDVGR